MKRERIGLLQGDKFVDEREVLLKQKKDKLENDQTMSSEEKVLLRTEIQELEELVRDRVNIQKKDITYNQIRRR